MSTSSSKGRSGIEVIHVVSGLMFGGGQRVVIDITETATACGDSPRIVLLGRSTSRFEALKPDCVAYDGRYNRVGTLLRTGIRLRTIIRSSQSELVHTHGWDADIVGWLASRKLKQSLILHLHVMPNWLKSREFKHVVRRWLTRRMFASRDVRVVAVSQAVREHWERFLPCRGAQIQVIHNGVDTRLYEKCEEARERLGRKPVVGVASRLVGEKGVRYFLEAIRILAHKGVSCQVLIAGEGPERNVLEEITREGNTKIEVSFLGQLEDMSEFLGRIDVFVCPSLSEGMPIGMLEAMAAGRPIVATRVGGIPEAIRDGVDGVLIAPRDPVVLAEALAKIIEDDDFRRTIAANALERARDYFSINRVYEELSTLYDNMLVAAPRRVV